VIKEYPTHDFDGERYQFGRCFVDSEWKLMYVPIEKNVTKVIQSMVVPLGFQENNFLGSTQQHAPALIILRDPVQRWISGVVEYFLQLSTRTYVKNNITQLNFSPELISKQIVFDIHTCPQHRFIEMLQGPKHYIWFDTDQRPQLIETLFRYFKQQGFDNTWAPENYKYDVNIVNISDQKKELTQTVRDMLDQPEMFQKIKNFYKADYQLIESIKFYS
jgi:hypothetical protein